MAKAEKTEEQAKTQVAVQPKAGLPVGLDLASIESDAGAGSQNMQASDMQTPIISVLQANSPQCKKSDGKYIKGAEEGMFFNNVTNEVYSGEDGLNVVPCFFEKVYIEWKPNRGGFVEAHNASTPLKDQIKMIPSSENPEKLIPVLPNGNLLIETNQHYVLRLKEDGGFEPAVIAMSSSALKTSRQWNYLVKSVTVQGSKGAFNPASYYSHYKLKTTPRQSDQYSWFGMNVENLGPVPSNDIYNAGRALEKAVNAGTVRVKQEPVETDSVPQTTAQEAPIDF
jgi:hypothetical protein